ncbi:MAG: tyrosine-type recombinase/integrase [Acetobacteraceae bacterium]
MSTSAGSSPPDREPPTIENRKVLVRKAIAACRSRDHLSEKEVGALIAAAASLGRHGNRDAALILVAYRHGLRVSELVSLRWDQVDLRQGLLHVARIKHGIASVHPLRGLCCNPLARAQGGAQWGHSACYVNRRAKLTPYRRANSTPLGLTRAGGGLSERLPHPVDLRVWRRPARN